MTKCKFKNCYGTVIDGFCDECGRPQSDEDKVIKLSDAIQNAAQGINSSKPSVPAYTRKINRSIDKNNPLGLGLVDISTPEPVRPLSLLMKMPYLQENKMFCPWCKHKVAEASGTCNTCGKSYDCMPSLKTGDVIFNRYEIKGPVALGGMDWIYLAFDKILERWVIIKGLINKYDDSSVEIARNERIVLGATSHPNIVEIYDFINYNNEGFIVMEFCCGKSIGTMLKENTTIPVKEAICYMIRILPAFSYLHSKGFVYCDFKPDNCMVADDVKLVDLGSVRKVDDKNAAIYGTRGFMAPEADQHPIEVSDLYSVGRTLAVMIMKFDYQEKYEYSLPEPKEQPILSENESLYKFLLKATNNNPNLRYQTADEMISQLKGILREIVSLESYPRYSKSDFFTYDKLIDADETEGIEKFNAKYIPSVKIDPNDSSAKLITDIYNSIPENNPLLRVRTIMSSRKSYYDPELAFKNMSFELLFRACELNVEIGKLDLAESQIKVLTRIDKYNWKINWLLGLLHIKRNEFKSAIVEFEKVYNEIPGELAPKLVLAYCHETEQNYPLAKFYYEHVAKVDPNYTTACFGAARCAIRENTPKHAIELLGMVPNSHSMSTLANISIIKVLMLDKSNINLDSIKTAQKCFDNILVENGLVHLVKAQFLSQILELFKSNKIKETYGFVIAGYELTVDNIRKGAENEYLKASEYETDKEEKRALISLAKKHNPHFWSGHF